MELPVIDETDKPTIQLRETLQTLRTHIDLVEGIREDREATLKLYKTEILPRVLLLRQLNRNSKDKLEEKHERVKELNRRLHIPYETCNNLIFEVSYLKYEVDVAKEKLSTKNEQVDSEGDVQMENEPMVENKIDFFDAEKVGMFDHQTRVKMLEEEETKRKALCEKLSHLKEETDNIELICSQTEEQLDQIKPFIKQLVDRVKLMEPPDESKQS